MPGALTNFGDDRVLNMLRGGGNVASSRWFALITATPSKTTTVATMGEVFTPATNGYNRAAITSGNWTTPNSTQINASAAVVLLNSGTNFTWGPFTATPVAPIVGVALVDSLTATTGNVTAYWVFDTARTAVSGDTISLPAGSLTLTVD